MFRGESQAPCQPHGQTQSGGCGIEVGSVRREKPKGSQFKDLCRKGPAKIASITGSGYLYPLPGVVPTPSPIRQAARHAYGIPDQLSEANDAYRMRLLPHAMPS